MKRLLDNPDHRDPLDRQLSELLAVMPRSAAEPARKRRIYARMTAHHVGSGTRSWPLGVRVAIVFGSLLLGTAAAAMVGQKVRSLWVTQRTPTPSIQPQPSPRARAMLLPAASSTLTPAVVASPAGASASGSVADSRSAARQTIASTEDPALVAAAIQALRNEHSPAKARALLNQYLRTNPRGALAEDALALSIEAADAMKDPAAAILGCKYLKLYPGGRHRLLASGACENSQRAPE